MHYLAKDNDDALFMLTKTWGGATFGFIEDLMEQAEDTEGEGSALSSSLCVSLRDGETREGSTFRVEGTASLT